MEDSTARLIEAVQRKFNHEKIVMADALRKMNADRTQVNISVSENVIRLCLEAVLNKVLPFDKSLPVEMAIRLASYAISILPDEDHHRAIEAVRSGLRPAHERRMRRDIRISTEWRRG